MPFSQSLEAYLWKYPETEQKIEELLGEIDTKVVSEVFTDEETGKQMVFFPILKNWKVVGTLYGLVNEQKTELYFYPHMRGEERLEPIYEMFENYYSKVKTSRGINDIETVHIVKFRPVKGSRGSDISLTLVLDLHLNVSKSLEDTEFGGESGLYGGGGGVYDPATVPSVKSPCDQNRDIANSSTIKSKNDFLKTKTGDSKENGYTFDYYGGSIVARENGRGSTADNMSVSIRETTIGYNHTHIEKEGVVNMFSPSDISTFITILKNANHNNLPIDGVFGVLVFKEGGKYYTYQMIYNGSKSNIPKSDFTKEQMNKFNESYAEKAVEYLDGNYGNLSRSDTHQLFMETLKEMGIGGIGIELSNISDLQNVVRIVEERGKAIEIKCNNIDKLN